MSKMCGVEIIGQTKEQVHPLSKSRDRHRLHSRSVNPVWHGIFLQRIELPLFLHVLKTRNFGNVVAHPFDKEPSIGFPVPGTYQYIYR